MRLALSRQPDMVTFYSAKLASSHTLRRCIQCKTFVSKSPFWIPRACACINVPSSRKRSALTLFVPKCTTCVSIRGHTSVKICVHFYFCLHVQVACDCGHIYVCIYPRKFTMRNSNTLGLVVVTFSPVLPAIHNNDFLGLISTLYSNNSNSARKDRFHLGSLRLSDSLLHSAKHIRMRTHILMCNYIHRNEKNSKL